MYLTVDWDTIEIVLKAPIPKSFPIRFTHYEEEAMYYGECEHNVQFYNYLRPTQLIPIVSLPLKSGGSHLLVGPLPGTAINVNRFRLWERYNVSKSPTVPVCWQGHKWHITYDFAMSLDRVTDFNILCVSRDIVYHSWTQVPRNEPFTFLPFRSKKCYKRP